MVGTQDFSSSGVFIEASFAPPDFAPVSNDEMAFALTLFVEAANGRVPFPMPTPQDVLRDGDDVCDQLYQTLCADVERVPLDGRARRASQTTLYAAFETLCCYYQGDPLQAAVCARVLAFYFLMERSAGAALAGWMQPHPDVVQFVELHPLSSKRLRRCG